MKAVPDTYHVFYTSSILKNQITLQKEKHPKKVMKVFSGKLSPDRNYSHRHFLWCVNASSGIGPDTNYCQHLSQSRDISPIFEN